jgi:hypothetical protein
VREPKESQQKHVKLGFLQDEEQKDVCVVTALLLFLQKTSSIRGYLPGDHTLLLKKALNQTDTTKITSIQPATVPAWLSNHLKNAGVDASYKPHSIRSASSTKAVMQGMDIRKVKEHAANWSLTSDTFEKFYYKPSMQIHNSTKVQNSIFSTEKSTTSKSEAKATRIVLGTTNNTDVAEEKDEEVVQTQPWHRRFFN